MIKTFTPNDVIRYFYKETTEEEFVMAIEKAMGCIEAAHQFGQEFQNQPLGVDNLMSLLDAIGVLWRLELRPTVLAAGSLKQVQRNERYK